METKWEDKKIVFRDTKYNSLTADYENRIEKAGDKKFAHYQIKSEVNEEYYKLKQDDSLFQKTNRGIIFLKQDIAQLMRMNKEYNYSSAFEFHTTSFSEDEKEQIIKQLADIDAHESCLQVLEEQTKILTEKDDEHNANNRDNDETKGNEKLTMKQQLLLLQSLGILNIQIIKEIENTKKAKLFSALLNRDDENIRKALSYINGESLRSTENIKKVNELLNMIGLTELIIK